MSDLRDSLVREGILIRDCSTYTYKGMGDRYFRLAVKRYQQNLIVIEKLKEIVR